MLTFEPECLIILAPIVQSLLKICVLVTVLEIHTTHYPAMRWPSWQGIDERHTDQGPQQSPRHVAKYILLGKQVPK